MNTQTDTSRHELMGQQPKTQRRALKDADITPERMREHAEALWKLIDDIDTATDIYKPEDSPFVSYVYKTVALRFEQFASDGYKLYVKE